MLVVLVAVLSQKVRSVTIVIVLCFAHMTLYARRAAAVDRDSPAVAQFDTVTPHRSFLRHIGTQRQRMPSVVTCSRACIASDREGTVTLQARTLLPYLRSDDLEEASGAQSRSRGPSDSVFCNSKRSVLITPS